MKGMRMAYGRRAPRVQMRYVFHHDSTCFCKGKLLIILRKPPKKLMQYAQYGYHPKTDLFCFIKFENTNYISSAIIFKCTQDEIMPASHITLIDMNSRVIWNSPSNNVTCKIRNKITFSYCIHLEIIFCRLGLNLQSTPRSTNPVYKIAFTRPGMKASTNTPISKHALYLQP